MNVTGVLDNDWRSLKNHTVQKTVLYSNEGFTASCKYCELREFSKQDIYISVKGMQQGIK